MYASCSSCFHRSINSYHGCFKVEICADTNQISVWNNGNGIPVVMHQEHNVYVPELIFGHLLTGTRGGRRIRKEWKPALWWRVFITHYFAGSNFDDDEKKTTGGRNGYGAKLTNIFSKFVDAHPILCRCHKQHSQDMIMSYLFIREFIIETNDSQNGKHYMQKFENNMSVKNKPTISKSKGKDFTQVKFIPDLKR
jgi:DNA topoisomerase-2